ncbi:acetyl-CoA synthetase-like protein [Thozetella sp. PMI_491]|nr:acetyl-CoA synthetase-like protein [Thozetella sp. PMI_491]
MVIESRWKVDIPKCSLQQWIFSSATDPLPDRKAFIDPEQPDTHFLTLSDYRLLAKRVALGLQAAGLPKGGRVLVFSGNHIYYPSLFIGVLAAGGIFTGANPTFTPRELAYQLKDSEASFAIVADYALETAFEAAKEAGLPRDRIFVFGGNANSAEIAHASAPLPGAAGRVDGARHWTELLKDNLSEAKGWSWTEPENPAETTCCLNYSSGTTGVPKGVEISHSSYVANGVGVIFLSENDPSITRNRAAATALCFLPMYHAYAQTYFVANYAKNGIPSYVMPKFDFIKMLEYVQKYRITSLTCVPPVVVALAKHPAVKNYDLSSVIGIGCGAAPLASEVQAEVQGLFPSGDVYLRQGWGMTELTCTALAWDLTLDAKDGVGELIPNARARLVDPDTGKEIRKAKTRGEIWVSAPTVMRGYWRKEQATRDTVHVDKDGTRWLKTGDIAYVDKYGPGGIFFIVDRLKELIKVKGNQVAPAELEGILLERPDVVDAAVIGVTIKGEEVPRAYIVREPSSKTSGKEIAEWLSKKVARYKRLKGGVVFIDTIPKNPILRKHLRELAAKEVGDRKPTASKLA